MSLAEYQRVTFDKFMGLYARGLADDCPIDHSPNCQNNKFNRRGEVGTRSGTIQSFNISTNVARMHVATFNNDLDILLTCDGAGNIYRQDTGAVLLSVANMVDFRALNVFNFCLICPILSTNGTPVPVYIWQGGIISDPIPIRPAAGHPPTTAFTATETGSGNCDIGVHQFAVSYITNSSYTTQPGPVITGVFTSVTVTSTGNKEITLTGIPLGPSGTIARQIFATQADQDLFFYCPNGLINDNTTTTLVVNFFDTDLAVSADSLFDLIPVIPGGANGEAGGIVEYHGRTLYFGGEFDLVRVSNPGDCESIDDVAGFIQLPSQFDGNVVRGACVMNDNLYFAKGFGIIAATDNGGDPDTWYLATIDGGVGATMSGMGTINLSQTGQTQNNVLLLGDFGGIYVFNGVVTQPPLTWKIDDIWQTIVNTVNIQTALTISIDPYNKLIYILAKGISFLLVGDYNEGLDSQSIKWTKYIFPFTPTAIGMAFVQDLTNFVYSIRIGTAASGIFKIQAGLTQDSSTPINSIYATSYVGFDLGAINIFRFIRMRAHWSGQLNIFLQSEDQQTNLTPIPFTLTLSPTGGTPVTSSSVPDRDLTREFNFMNEKCSVQLSTNAGTDNFLLQRLDLFGKPRFAMRPGV